MREIAMMADQKNVGKPIGEQRVNNVGEQQFRRLGPNIETTDERAEHAINAPVIRRRDEQLPARFRRVSLRQSAELGRDIGVCSGRQMRTVGFDDADRQQYAGATSCRRFDLRGMSIRTRPTGEY